MSPRYEPVLFAFFMALIMSGAISLVIPLINLGLREDLLMIWLRGWLVGFLVALPISLVVVPVVRRMVSRMCGTDVKKGKG